MPPKDSPYEKIRKSVFANFPSINQPLQDFIADPKTMQGHILSLEKSAQDSETLGSNANMVRDIKHISIALGVSGKQCQELLEKLDEAAGEAMAICPDQGSGG
jgi:hypothetical protein